MTIRPTTANEGPSPTAWTHRLCVLCGRVRRMPKGRAICYRHGRMPM